MSVNVDVLLVCVTDVERDELLLAAEAVTSRKATLQPRARRTYYDLGEILGARIALLQSEMGSVTPGGSLASIIAAVQEIKPRVVMMVGIAFGIDKHKQRIGQVLVSRQLQLYEIERVGLTSDKKTQIIPRGDRISASGTLLSRLKAAAYVKREISVQFGLMLTGEKLLDDPAFKERLVSQFPEAIGGEMEGAGLVSANDGDYQWIVVKGICDWADGNKTRNKKSNQLLAARNAACLAITTLTHGGFSTPLSDTPVEPEHCDQSSRRTNRLPSRQRLVGDLLSTIEHTARDRAILVAGSIGCDAMGVTSLAVSQLNREVVEIDLAQQRSRSGEELISVDLLVLERIAGALGNARTPRFRELWDRYTRCLGITKRMRTLTERSGDPSYIRHSSNTLALASAPHASPSNLLLILKRVLHSQSDIDLVLRPHLRLTEALVNDIDAGKFGNPVLSVFGIPIGSNASLRAVEQTVSRLQVSTSNVRLVVTTEIVSKELESATSFLTFHVPQASTSEFEMFLNTLHTEKTQGEEPNVGMIASLSFGSLAVANFLTERPRLIAWLASYQDYASSGRFSPTDAWTVLCLAYSVTPHMLESIFVDRMAASILLEIPDGTDGIRQIPSQVAAPILRARSPNSLKKLNQILADYTEALDASVHVEPTQTLSLEKVFHRIIGDHELHHVNLCLLREFRISTSFCVQLYRALTRLLTIMPLPAEPRTRVAQIVSLIEFIDAGEVSDRSVRHFFESMSIDEKLSTRDRAIAFYQLGHSYFASKQFDLALMALTYATDCDSEYFNALSLLGVVLSHCDQVEQAITVLDEAILRKCDYEFAHFNLGTICERNGAVSEAALSYISALGCDPYFYEAAYNLSNVLLMLGLLDDAAQVAIFTGAIVHELRVEPIFNIANAIAATGDFRAAIKIYRSCLNERRDSRIVLNLGLAYACNLQYDIALSFLKEAKEMAQSDEDRKIVEIADAARLEAKHRRPIGNVFAHVQPAAESNSQLKQVKLRVQELYTVFHHLGLDQRAVGIRRTIARAASNQGLASFAYSEEAQPLDSPSLVKVQRRLARDGSLYVDSRKVESSAGTPPARPAKFSKPRDTHPFRIRYVRYPSYCGG